MEPSGGRGEVTASLWERSAVTGQVEGPERDVLLPPSLDQNLRFRQRVEDFSAQHLDRQRWQDLEFSLEDRAAAIERDGDPDSSRN